jgi:hypothetical protein
MQETFGTVVVDTLWKARLRKEIEAQRKVDSLSMEMYGSTRNFQMNLANQCAEKEGLRLKYPHNRIEDVVEKEIKQSPQERSSLKGLDGDSLEAMAMQHLKKRPTQKWDVPQLASHEVGWLLANPVRSHSVEPPRRHAKRQAKRLERLGLLTSGSTPVWPPKSTWMPTSNRVMDRIRSAPHIVGNETHQNIAKLNRRTYFKPNQCDVTAYAETYVHHMKHDPFNQAKAGR